MFFEVLAERADVGGGCRGSAAASSPCCERGDSWAFRYLPRSATKGWILAVYALIDAVQDVEHQGGGAGRGSRH